MSRSVLWRGLRWPSLEHVEVDIGPAVTADGLVVGAFDGTPFRLRYALECDRDWAVRKLFVDDLTEASEPIALVSDGQGSWSDADSRPFDDFADCVDVDIAATPFTNTLPIRRLRLAAGESAEIDVLYLSVFPGLELKRVRQRYTHLHGANGVTTYLYEALSSEFAVELTVDSDGLVNDYPGVWERVPPAL